MKGYHFLMLFCTVAVFDAGIYDHVWLRGQDINNHSEELQFLFYKGEKWTYLYLKERPRMRAESDMDVIQSLTDGSQNSVNSTLTENSENKCYQNTEYISYFTVRCIKRVGRHCARTLEGILTIEDKDFQITPVSFPEYITLDTNYTLHFLQEHKGYDGRNICSNEDVELNNYYMIARIQANDRTIQVSDLSASSTVKARFCALQGQTTFTILADGIIAAECNHLTVNVFMDYSDSASATLCTNSELNSYMSPSAQCFNLEIKGDNAVHGGHITITAADEHENVNTKSKTFGQITLLEEYLEKNNETRPIHEVPAPALQSILSILFLTICQNDGSEYEPTTSRGMMGSFERYLRRNRFNCSLGYGPEFYQAREALKGKQKDLKMKGKGNKPKTADATTDDDITV